MSRSITFKRRLLPICISAVAFSGVTSSTIAQEENYEEVIVTGIRGALTRAIDVKRDAGSVVDAISAEDIGKLPDATIADSLQRVTGIQIRRSAGEGSTVNVRGMPQVNTLLNGEQFLSAGSITTLQPNFTDIPAELLSRVDVIKSSEASTLSGGVAGTIDLRTQRPLDLAEGWTFVGAGELSDGSYTDDNGTKLSGFAGYHSDDFGALLSVSTSSATLANFRYGMYNDWWFRGYQEDGNWPGWSTPTDVTGDGDTNDAIFGTIDYGVTNRTSERDRTGISATVQYRVNDKVEVLGDVFYTSMDQYEHTNGLVADNAWAQYDWVYPQNPVNRGPSADGNTDKDFYTASVFDLHALRVTAKAESFVDKRESTNINLQTNIDFTDSFRASVRYIHGSAENKHTGNFADAFITTGEQHGLQTRVDNVTETVNPNGEGPDRIVIRGDMSGTHPSFTYPEGFGDSIEKYGLVSSFSHQNRDEESKLDVLRFDGILDLNDNNSLEFGYRYGKREVTRYQYDYVAPFTRRGMDDEQITVYSKWKDSGLPVNGDPGAGVFGDTIARTIPFTELDAMGWITEVSDFGPAPSDGRSFYFIDPKAMDDALGFHNTLYPGNVAIKDPGRSYELDDKTHTLYAQANFEGEFGVPYQANFGVQYIRTFLDVTTNVPGVEPIVEVDGVEYPTLTGTPPQDLGDSTVERSFTDFLPRFNIGFDTSENTKLRLAYTKTMTQLDANDLGLGLVYTVNNNADLGVFQAVSASQDGNPYMEPWRAENYDATFEWYFAESSMASIGLYRLDVATSITTTGTTTAAVPDSDGVIRDEDGEIGLTIRDNTDGGVVQGIELGYQQAFDFLPGAFSGLGTTFTYTWADGEGGDKDFYGATMPMGDNSEHQFNAILWYEMDGWQARVAMNYRSERYIGRAWNDGHPAAWWSAPTTYVDASVSYDITDGITVFLQGTNITEEYEETYMQWQDVVVNQNVFEARYNLGVRARF